MSEIGASLLGAVQGTVSVLLTVFAGFFYARLGLLDKSAVRRVSKLCSSVFLPCLLVVQIGDNLTPELLKSSWIIPVWGAVSTLVAHAVGWAGQRLFKLPAWTIVASGRANSTALPLMLLDGLSQAGVLDALQRSGESRSDLLARAKSLILLNVVVQQCITFAAGPEILARDRPSTSAQKRHAHRRPTIQDIEHVGLLAGDDSSDDAEVEEDRDEESLRRRHVADPFDRLANVPALPKLRLPRYLRWVPKALGFLNPPLIAAFIALILAFVGPLHHVLFDSTGALNVPVLQPISNLGDIYVALQIFIVGAELAVASSDERPSVTATAVPLSIRFLIMPVVALGFVWASAARGVYADDPLVWFLLVLIPTGPSAMVLATLADTVGVDQGPIAGYLLVANLCSPLIAATCAAALELVKHIRK